MSHPMRRGAVPCAAALRNARRALAMAASLLSACQASEQDAPPVLALPPGAELVLEVGDLEVYAAPGAMLCAGTLRRLQIHAEELASLFEHPIPSARIVLHEDLAGVNDACLIERDVAGCARQGGAHAVAQSALHELGHVFARSVTGVRASPFLAEGLADRLAGEQTFAPDGDLGGIDTWFPASAFDTNRALAAHFTAWMMAEFGLSTFLTAYEDSSGLDGAAAAAAVATAIGFQSPAELEEAYHTTRAFAYPALPQSVVLFAEAELAAGIGVDFSCDSELSEGLTNGEIRTMGQLEIASAGEYAVTGASMLTASFYLYRQFSIPVDEDLKNFEWSTGSCPYDTEVPHVDSPAAGKYRFTVDHSGDLEPFVLSAYPLGNAECTYP